MTSVKLTLAAEVRSWESAEPVTNPRTYLHELHLDGVMLLEFGGDGDLMSERVFDHVSELAAEAWLKAATRWRDTQKQPLRFSVAVVTERSGPAGSRPQPALTPFPNDLAERQVE